MPHYSYTDPLIGECRRSYVVLFYDTGHWHGESGKKSMNINEGRDFYHGCKEGRGRDAPTFSVLRTA